MNQDTLKQEEDYIKWVMSIIEKYKDSYNVIYNNEISPYLINEVLANYNHIFDMLNTEYQRCKSIHFKLKCEFDDWYDERFVEVRDDLILKSKSDKIKVSLVEIEKVLKVQHKDNYRLYRDKVNTADMKTSYMRRNLENWKKVDSVLNTLSNNLRSEMHSMSLISRINRNNNEGSSERKTR
jgi:hypothetical protein